MVKEVYYNRQEFCVKLDIKYYQLVYLFNTGKLNKQDFKVINNRVAYTEQDLTKVRKVLEKKG